MPHTMDFRKSSRSRSIGRSRLETLSRRVVRAVLDGEGLVDAEMGVHFVDDPEIQGLNIQYRNTDCPTDVIAFEISSPRERSRPGALLGDLFISIPTARRQALSMGHSLEAELSLLLIHGTLHLLGYDHGGPADAKRMHRREIRYLTACDVGLKHPGYGGK